MDNQSTFLEFPLDRDLYKPRKISECDKKPIRVLITEAGTKTAHQLMYKICSGQVFGPDQPVILHLVNARGCVSHKAPLLDLDECGFPALQDSVVSAEPEKSYGDVDVVVIIALLEELSGHNMFNTFLCQLNKIRNVAKYTAMYAKPDAKLVVCGPSTKGVIILLACMKMFEPQMNVKHISGVVYLDVTIAKALTAAQLKTTTDNIKNVVIWGNTCPDLRNATVLMYAPDDRAKLQKLEIPVMQVLGDEKWIYSELIPKLYKRILTPDLAKHGGAVASATAQHLKLLFQGSDNHEEIVSMAVIVPPHEPCGLTRNISFSLPVTTNNGEVTIREDVDCAITTQLMNIRCMYNDKNDSELQEIYKAVKYIKEYERVMKRKFLWSQHTHLTDKWHFSTSYMRYIISPRHDETATIDDKEVTSKKSITWEENHFGEKSGNSRKVKSVLRFNLQM